MVAFTNTTQFLQKILQKQWHPLSKLSKEKKTCYLARYFDINLLQIDSNTDIGLNFDELTDTYFTPLITSPARVTPKTKSLINNIFFKEFFNNIVIANLSVNISDHMPQYATLRSRPTNWLRHNVVCYQSEGLQRFSKISPKSWTCAKVDFSVRENLQQSHCIGESELIMRKLIGDAL